MRRLSTVGSAALATLALYQARVLPRVRRELATWEQVAEGTPDPVLRGTALGALREKGSNVEAVAVFATLAPAADRSATVHGIVALQVAIDYLDSLAEQPGEDPLADGLRLHSSLATAFAPGAGDDWYRHHPQRDDGGYLDRLLASCRAAFASLPSAEAVAPVALAAAVRCGEGQGRTHAAIAEPEPLRSWAQELGPPGFNWWETAAGASSSVAAHALIAFAARPGISQAEATLVDNAYFPAVGALTVLLDDLVDREDDLVAGEHSYLDYYADADEAAERIEAIALMAEAAECRLPEARRHAAILAGVLSFYLANPGSTTPYAAPIRARLLTGGRPLVRALTFILRLRHA